MNLTTWAQNALVLMIACFVMLALGYGLVTGKLSYEALVALVTGLASGGAVHYIYRQTNGHTPSGGATP